MQQQVMPLAKHRIDIHQDLVRLESEGDVHIGTPNKARHERVAWELPPMTNMSRKK